MFIDACYDAKVAMYFDSSCNIEELWDSGEDIEWGVTTNSNGDLLGTGTYVSVDTFTRFSLDRTVSRLYEMTSDDYVAESGIKHSSGEESSLSSKMGLMEKGFAAADMNGDGMLDKAEVLVLLQGLKIVLGGEVTEEMVDELFEVHDVDQNGKLDKEEFHEYIKQRLGTNATR